MSPSLSLIPLLGLWGQWMDGWVDRWMDLSINGSIDRWMGQMGRAPPWVLGPLFSWGRCVTSACRTGWLCPISPPYSRVWVCSNRIWPRSWVCGATHGSAGATLLPPAFPLPPLSAPAPQKGLRGCGDAEGRPIKPRSPQPWAVPPWRGPWWVWGPPAPRRPPLLPPQSGPNENKLVRGARSQ